MPQPHDLQCPNVSPCPSPAKNSLHRGARPQPETLQVSAPGNHRAAADAEVLARSENLVGCGAVRDALRCLLRSAEQLESDTQARLRDPIYRGIALCYGLLGHDQDAREWCGIAHRHALSGGSFDAVTASDALFAGLAHLAGNHVATIRIANQALSQHSRRDGDSHRNVILSVLGGSYLRLGQIGKAEQCVHAIMKSPPERAKDIGFNLGLLLSGDIRLWTIVRQHPHFRGQLLFVDELSGLSHDESMLARDALEVFKRAHDYAAGTPYLQQLAQAGMAKARLVCEPSAGDWQFLEKHAQWMAERGILYQRDLTRLHLGVWRLMHNDSSLARHALVPLAGAAMAKAATTVEHDALFCGAVAAGRCGDTQSAFGYLSEYNTRIRQQNLSRVAVPPPNVDSQVDDINFQDIRRRSEDLDDLIVDRVAAYVRAQPGAPTASDELAAMAGVSRRTLQYRFRRATGKSPKEFVTSLRLEEAKKALGNATGSRRRDLEELSKATGFPNYRSFVRAFTKAYGMSPAEAVLHSEADSGGA